MIHRDTLLKKSKYTCFLHNADGFVAHSVSNLGGVSGQVWAVIYSLVTFWRDCEYFCRGLPYVSPYSVQPYGSNPPSQDRRRATGCASPITTREDQDPSLPPFDVGQPNSAQTRTVCQESS